MDELLRDHATFVQPAGGSAPSGVSLQTRVSELESEVSKLREQLAKAKGINDTMWETVVQKVVVESRGKKEGSTADMDVDGPEAPNRRSKRARA